ncbi:methyltransferase domain-containing protein [Chlorobium sp. BLA1]|uniref:class I SAM-dependent methyltransferase n=1 Tax=Candidatus Chlorobium masyuteum TaxID=2716876 RepID=UPI0014226412|nr:class I SAM-dependent methyltransferase [Candidatus Chlorobium masyuteum]NHQ59176.1 methyltransferase domain-containing protein [Candidatus Chlorobium masyuteum]
MQDYRDSIIAVVQCPSCACALHEKDGEFLCSGCQKRYPLSAFIADFVELQQRDAIAKKALVTWGENLHHVSSDEEVHSGHFSQFEDVFGSGFFFAEGSRLLEIGCGAGEDAVKLAKSRSDLDILAMDIGENVKTLAERFRTVVNLHFIRGDARLLPLKASLFDYVVSFGVFHHTDDPEKCVKEAFRVLKTGGTAFVYLYKNHEDDLFKRSGIIAETLLMQLIRYMPHRMAQFFCHLLAWPCLLFFSWPAWIMKRIPHLSKLGNAMPLHWGTSPHSIYGDLEDRLLAPVNHRYSYKKFLELFRDAGFTEIKVVTGSGGHYARATKLG